MPARTDTLLPTDLDRSPEPIDLVVAIAREGAKVRLDPAALRQISRTRSIVERRLRDGDAHYGINTGFGSLAKQRIGADDLRSLQRNLVRSHSAGVLAPLPTEIVRGTMLLLAASLARGVSGVRPEVIESLVRLLNRGVTPVVPSVGSVGASGDLAPLAAIACVLIGEGRVWVDGEECSAADGLRRARVKPLVLEAKEGLALINGTHLMAAEGAMLCHDAGQLLNAALVALAMSIDACRASHSFLDRRLYAARSHLPGLVVAECVAELLQGSTIRTSHLENDPRVQDPYSLRAGVTVLGAVVRALGAVEASIEDELRAVTDNPLVFPKGRLKMAQGELTSEDEAIVSGANFHGMPVALPLDYLAIALSHLAGVSERRTYLITGAFEPESHLKPFLTPRPGLQSGFMIAQYTAAACVNELVGLANPASVANVPTCAGMEDYNSFGPRAAAKARRGIELARRVVAIELLCAAQGLEVHRPLRSGEGVERARKILRRRVPALTEDRPLTADIEATAELIASGAFSG